MLRIFQDAWNMNFVKLSDVRVYLGEFVKSAPLFCFHFKAFQIPCKMSQQEAPLFHFFHSLLCPDALDITEGSLFFP